MATSAKPSLPNDDNNVQVYGLGLGDITIGLGNSGQQPMAASQQLPMPGINDLGGNPYLNHQQHLSTQGAEPRQTSLLSNKIPGGESSAKKDGF